MTTFKHGDRVTCEIAGIKITDARISISDPRIGVIKGIYICQNTHQGDDAMNKLGYKYSWRLDNNFCDDDVKNLRLAEKTLDDIEVGDKLLCEGEEDTEREVVFRSGDFVVYKYLSFGKYKASANWLVSELKKEGFKVKQPELEVPAPIKMTVAEIAKKLGHEVEIIK